MLDTLHATDQISFVSKQTVPVALGYSWIKPKVIHLIQTPQVIEYTKYIINYFDKKNIKYEIYNVTSMRQEELQNKLDEIFEKCGDKVNFNLTNGTKLQTIASTEWLFNHSDISTLYIDTQNNEVVCPKLGENWTYDVLPEVLRFEDLLRLNGYTVEKYNKTNISITERKGMKRLLEIFCNDDKMMQQLNDMASSAKNAPYVTTDKYPKSVAWSEVLDICQSLGKLQYANDHISFTTKENKDWCNGIWLEEYVQSILYKLLQDKVITDYGVSVHVNKNGIKNEMDAVFTANNRLYSIECKTERMNKQAYGYEEKDEKQTGYIYKLDSLQEKMGGTFSAGMFCSVTKLRKADEERAKQNKITLAVGNDLLQLERIIKSTLLK